MKRLIISIFALFSIAVNAADYKEGVNYRDLGDKSFDAPNQVTKVYSVNCPFCYKFDEAKIPLRLFPINDLKFEEWHVLTKPPFGEEKSDVLAVATIMGEKQFEKVKKAYYHNHHALHIEFKTAEEARNFGLEALGISKATLDEKLKDPKVRDLLDNKWKHATEVAKVQGIPAIVVNGKYLVITKAITSMDDLKSLIIFLSQKK